MSAAIYQRIPVYDIRVGDTIRKEYDTPPDTFAVRALEYTAPNEKDGWDGLDGRYYLIKRAPVPLPTEPGLYVDRDDDIWKIEHVGARLRLLWSSGNSKALTVGVDQYAPFRRLYVEIDVEK